MTAIPFDAFVFTHALQESNSAIIEQVKYHYQRDGMVTNKDLDARIKETELKIELVCADLKRDIEVVRKEIAASHTDLIE